MKAATRGLAATATLALSAAAHGQSIDILSAGAVEPGILAAAEAYKKQTGTEVKVRFATAPMILKQMGDGAKADVVLAPPPVLDQLAKDEQHRRRHPHRRRQGRRRHRLAQRWPDARLSKLGRPEEGRARSRVARLQHSFDRPLHGPPVREVGHHRRGQGEGQALRQRRQP